MTLSGFALLDHHHADNGDDQNTRNENEEHDIQRFHGGLISAEAHSGPYSPRTSEDQFRPGGANPHSDPRHQGCSNGQRVQGRRFPISTTTRPFNAFNPDRVEVFWR